MSEQLYWIWSTKNQAWWKQGLGNLANGYTKEISRAGQFPLKNVVITGSHVSIPCSALGKEVISQTLLHDVLDLLAECDYSGGSFADQVRINLKNFLLASPTKRDDQESSPSPQSHSPKTNLTQCPYCANQLNIVILPHENS